MRKPKEIRTREDLKGHGYRPATVEGIRYMVKYDIWDERPIDVLKLRKDGVVLKLQWHFLQKVMDILEERKVKWQGGRIELIGIGDGPYDSYYDCDGFGFG